MSYSNLLSLTLFFCPYPERNDKTSNRKCKDILRHKLKDTKYRTEDDVSHNDLAMSIRTKHPFVISSRLFHNVCAEDDLMRIRTEIKILLMSEFDSHQGIPVESNQPLGSPNPLINLTRPAVLRIYYGLTKSSTRTLNSIRPTYGPTSTSSSVGMDPHNFTTKAMSLNLFNIGEQVRSFLKSQSNKDVVKCLSSQFNHCTVLIYSGENNNGSSNSSLAFHSDCTFDHSGNYLQRRNSQKENTCVAVLTLGDSRTLHFKKRVVVKNKTGRKRWVETQDEGQSFVLCDNSVFMLVPSDEKPCLRSGDEYVSQYIHGGINITNKNDLSIAFAFRVVCQDHEYDPVTSKLIPKVDFLRRTDNYNSEQNQRLRDCLHNFRRDELDTYSKRFHSFVHTKFNSWNW